MEIAFGAAKRKNAAAFVAWENRIDSFSHNGGMAMIFVWLAIFTSWIRSMVLVMVCFYHYYNHLGVYYPECMAVHFELEPLLNRFAFASFLLWALAASQYMQFVFVILAFYAFSCFKHILPPREAYSNSWYNLKLMQRTYKHTHTQPHTHTHFVYE